MLKYMSKTTLFLCAALAIAVVQPSFAGAPERSSAISAKYFWARATAGGVPTVAVYGVLENLTGNDDALESVSSEFSQMAQIHRTTVSENGYMSMDEMPEVELPNGHYVQLEPGEIHMMLMGVKRSLKAGDEIPLRLKFKNSPAIHVRAKVYPIGATWADIVK